MRKSNVLFLPVILGFVFSGCPCDRDEDNPTGPGGVVDTTRPEIFAPYQNFSEIEYIHQAYSSTAACPWGFVHNGVDFSPYGDSASFQAVSSGRVERLEKYYNSVASTWQVNLSLRINSRYWANYAFEPLTSNPAHADTQMAMIQVALGQTVSRGQLLGRLLARGHGYHLHFGLYKDDQAVCPESFFTTGARDSILIILRRAHPGAAMCY